ncbi:MAG: LamB/YcsF family protein [Nitrososphaerota archaeon]|nr:LamB/YcsF family protein [Nitrososphaerota archaeon]
MKAVDINSDMGESLSVYRTENDERLLRYVTSANIACGYHAGDPVVMAATIAACKRRGVGIGAHPSFPDRKGFGRRRMEVGEDELVDMLAYQVGALDGIARSLDASVFHIKAHGALYNMAWKRKDYADAIARCARLFGKAVLAPADSAMEVSARAAKVRFAAEAFADRGYLSDGTLAPRGKPGALITDPSKAAERALRLLDGSAIKAVDGGTVQITAMSLCVHGDTPGASLIARAVSNRLKAAGFRPRPLGKIL